MKAAEGFAEPWSVGGEAVRAAEGDEGAGSASLR